MWTACTGLLVAAVVAATGCTAEPRGGTDGTPPTGRSAAVESPPEKVPTVCTGCVTEERLGQTVAVEATVAQQCPARGCWFRMKDDAGEVMVDLAPKKLELSESRVGQKAKVTGTVVKKGGKFWLEAQKVEFTTAGKDTPPEKK
ncbi:hypothetical protein J0H58_16730 [bacterium]|nr:hypothetical protein [bacterium]